MELSLGQASSTPHSNARRRTSRNARRQLFTELIWRPSPLRSAAYVARVPGRSRSTSDLAKVLDILSESIPNQGVGCQLPRRAEPRCGTRNDRWGNPNEFRRNKCRPGGKRNALFIDVPALPCTGETRHSPFGVQSCIAAVGGFDES